jgi:hypothetical protein
MRLSQLRIIGIIANDDEILRELQLDTSRTARALEMEVLLIGSEELLVDPIAVDRWCTDLVETLLYLARCALLS